VDVVMGRGSFEELEDHEQFWDPKLLLPEGLTREQLYEEHIVSLEKVGAHFPPPSAFHHQLSFNGHSRVFFGSFLSQASSVSLQGSQSQYTLNDASLNNSMSMNANGTMTLVSPLTIPLPPSQNFTDDIVNWGQLSGETPLHTSELIDLNGSSSSNTNSPTDSAEKELDFDEWLNDIYENDYGTKDKIPNKELIEETSSGLY
jgi:hypothetical protein